MHMEFIYKYRIPRQSVARITSLGVNSGEENSVLCLCLQDVLCCFKVELYMGAPIKGSIKRKYFLYYLGRCTLPPTYAYLVDGPYSRARFAASTQSW